MFRFTLSFAVALACSAFVLAEDQPETPAAEAEAIAPFDGDANDLEALREYASKAFREIAVLLRAEKPDEAEAKLKAFKEFVAEIKPTEKDAKTMHGRIGAYIKSLGEEVELARVSLEELQKQLREAPSEKAVRRFAMKFGPHLQSLVSTDLDKAEKELASAKAMLDKVAESSESDPGVARAVRLTGRMFKQLEQVIENERKLAELVGKDAIPLDVKEWVNGKPLSDDDLKGKVVLLDFWAVWCGPCIATFPNLREWHDKYADKGLVIVGLTRYYNFYWDEEKGTALQSTDEVAPEAEREMLEKFAAKYELEHRFAIQEDRTLSEFYAVVGIPHLVVIDREGKIRLIKVGAGEGTAEEVGALLEELIAN